MFWRKMMGLPITQPYPQAHLGHQDIYTPEHWMENRDYLERLADELGYEVI